MVLYRLCTYILCAGSDEGLGGHLVGPWCVVFNVVFFQFRWLFPVGVVWVGCTGLGKPYFGSQVVHCSFSCVFTCVMSILVWFTLLQFYWFQSYMISGGVGTSVHHSLPRFHRGKTAPGGGRGSRGPPTPCDLVRCRLTWLVKTDSEGCQLIRSFLMSSPFFVLQFHVISTCAQ